MNEMCITTTDEILHDHGCYNTESSRISFATYLKKSHSNVFPISWFNVHVQESYKGERDYDETLFHNMVERVYIDDHNVPRIRDMIDFTANVREWMQKDKQNIIAIHCKGGKGRTGTMICVWLIDCGVFEQAEESLEYFGDRRTDLTVGKRFQGVETPSQSRYVGYYEKVLKEFGRGLPPRREKKIVSVKIEGLTGVGNGDGSDLSMEIRADGLLIYECHFGTNVNCQVMRYTDSDSIVIELKNQPAIADDIKIRFLSKAKNIPKVLHLSRDEIDNPHKKKAQKVFRDCFTVELKFGDVENERTSYHTMLILEQSNPFLYPKYTF
ncbi:hypothetical protein KUTeg_024089 [Tegillarca granosa]|uniref:Phosphatidylinositol-3,4,5-trisphosphate 3-phosphatase n=1 Tax=Tegillarca granosa TaxID=220873 RepID=A0ABQ9DWC3_TEGGR|nr:hypothetical protein KUTeg_024089 [Tegillarca granosa]